MKKIEKMSLANLQGKLSRKEMKSISGGSGGGGNNVPSSSWGGSQPFGYWPLSTPLNSSQSANSLSLAYAGQTLWNAGVMIVNGAAWVGNQISPYIATGPATVTINKP